MLACAAFAAARQGARSFSGTTQGRYADKVAIVTGGSRGIGEGCVRAFSKAGAKVVFCGLPSHAEVGRKLAARLVSGRLKASRCGGAERIWVAVWILDYFVSSEPP